nr:hypothetical protein [Tanacetum cinerariifolium]
MSEDIQYGSSHTRPPMLDMTDYESWQLCIRLYCQGKDNGENIMKSIVEDLTQEEKDRYKADIRATNILLQGLSKDMYALINHYTDTKDIWDNVKMLLEGSKLTKDDRESQLYDDFEHFRQNKGETIHYYYVRYNANNQRRQFQRNNARGFVRTENAEGQNIVRNLNPGRAKPVKCYNYNGIGHIAQELLDDEQLLFLAGEQVTDFDDDVDDPPEQDLALNVDHVFEGTKSIYQSFVKPYLSKHEAEIDRTLMELKTRETAAPQESNQTAAACSSAVNTDDAARNRLKKTDATLA